MNITESQKDLCAKAGETISNLDFLTKREEFKNFIAQFRSTAEDAARNALIYPERVFLAQVGNLLDDSGRLKDAELSGRLEKQAAGSDYQLAAFAPGEKRPQS